MSYIKKVTEQLKNLVQMAHNRFPQNKDISLGLTGIETLCNHNRQKLFKIFLNHIYFKKSPDNVPFRKLIKERNDAFFLNRLAEDIVNIKTNNEALYNIINGIRNNWEELDQDEKNAIWTYFDVLFKLTDKHFIEIEKNKLINS